MRYQKNPPPGMYDHKSVACSKHGDQAPGFKVKGEDGPLQCVACAIEEDEALAVLAARMKPKQKRRVAIESPLKGSEAQMKRNKKYAKLCMRDSLDRGEAPYASHLLFDQEGLLDDTIPAERELGIMAGFAWTDGAELVAVYMDLGLSDGMKRRVLRSQELGQPVELRWLNVTVEDLEK